MTLSRGGAAGIGIVAALINAGLVHAVDVRQGMRLQVVSSRPDVVSGNDVLLQLAGADRSSWSAQLNGRDVTGAFRRDENSKQLLARLEGLKPGNNVLELKTPGTVASRLDIIAHLLAGPVFSGPHQEPFVCQTEANGLGTPLDVDCTARTRVQYYYKSTQASMRMRWARRRRRGLWVEGSRSTIPKVLCPRMWR